jgi:hypothetical protein
MGLNGAYSLGLVMTYPIYKHIYICLFIQILLAAAMNKKKQERENSTIYRGIPNHILHFPCLEFHNSASNIKEKM